MAIREYGITLGEHELRFESGPTGSPETAAGTGAPANAELVTVDVSGELIKNEAELRVHLARQ
jgi:hypothetical protein